MGTIRIVAPSLLALGQLVWASFRPSDAAELYIAPPNADELSQMFHAPDAWSGVRQKLTGIVVADHALEAVSEDELRFWFSQMKDWRLKLGLEVGAIKQWSEKGAETYRKEVTHWRRAERLGATVDNIAMDGPLAFTLNHMHAPIGYAVAETARFIAVVRKDYPDLSIGDIEPFPGLPLSTHLAWLDALQQQLSQQGVRGLDFYRLDVNWAAFAHNDAGGWAQVKDVEQGVHNRHLPFSLIYWASDFPALAARGLAGPDTWSDSIMAQGKAFASVGGQPDQYVIESWIGVPKQAVPESNPTTFTGSARRFIEDIMH